ncbi:MAG: hypothetical protein KY467_07810, partial [Gemmatimonadetes bacterium]|nr:hypothetical protein [Gemmatimonadota bacterium]
MATKVGKVNRLARLRAGADGRVLPDAASQQVRLRILSSGAGSTRAGAHPSGPADCRALDPGRTHGLATIVVGLYR